MNIFQNHPLEIHQCWNQHYSLVVSFLLMTVEAGTALPVACPYMGQHGQFGQRQRIRLVGTPSLFTRIVLLRDNHLPSFQRSPGTHDPDREQGGPGAETRRVDGRGPRDGATTRHPLHGDVGQGIDPSLSIVHGPHRVENKPFALMTSPSKGPAAEHRRRLQRGRAPHSAWPGRG